MQGIEVKKIQDLLEVPVSFGRLETRTMLITLQPSTAATLLRHYTWNSEKLTEQFWNDPAAALHSAGLSPPTSPSTRTVALPSTTASSSTPRRTRASQRSVPASPVKRNKSTSATAPFECPICCSDFSAREVEAKTLAFSCEHRFCKDCWTEYLSGKINTEGESARIQCMGSSCGRIVREETVDALLSPDVTKK